MSTEKRCRHHRVNLYSEAEQFIVPRKATWVWCRKCGAVRAPGASKRSSREWDYPNVAKKETERA